jgi:hypothetical protein
MMSCLNGIRGAREAMCIASVGVMEYRNAAENRAAPEIKVAEAI